MIIKKKYIIWAIIILAISVGIYFFFIKEKSAVVEKVEPQTLTVEKSVSVNGEIKSVNQAELSFGTTGRISQILVEEDTEVTSGQLLAQIDSSSAYQTLQSLDDAVDIAKRTKDEFVSVYAYDEEKRDAYGDRKYEDTLKKLDEQIHQAEAQYKAQLATLKNTTIRAPFAGIIVDVTKQESESATLGEKIITIVDMQKMYFEADLEQEDFGYVQLGQNVEIALDSYEEQGITFSGIVTEIPKFINPTDDSILIKITINETDVPILYGMTGEARIIIEKLENVSAVTFDEVFVDEDGNSYVWIVENERLKQKEVEIGLEGDIYTEIKTNLSEYTVVIPANEDVEFKEGLKVNLQNER